MGENSDDLLDEWLNFNDAEGEGAAEFTILKAPAQDSYPLSQTQKRLWLVYQKEPESPVYNYSEVWTFPNDSFDKNTFIKSLELLVKKHQILLSNYLIVKEEPRLVYPKRESFELLESEEKMEESSAFSWLKAKASRGFRLETDPLIRVAICPLTNGNKAVGITFHHIVIDAWSIGILKKDFAKFYAETSKGNLDQLTEERIQFHDFTVWDSERERKSSDKSNPEALQWDILELPLDHPRPARPSYRGGFHHFLLSKDLTKPIQKLAGKLETTDFNLFLAAFQILLSRYGKTEKISVGIPVLNREEEEVKNLVGYFVDTQVLQSQIDPNKSFGQFLEEVKNDSLAALTGEKPSYEELIKQSGIKASQSENPLFQAMFVGHSKGENPFHEHDLKVEMETLDLDVSKFDLTLHHFGEKNGAFAIGIEIASDLFEKAFADRMAAHFEALLFEITSNPEQAISELSLISEKERSYLISGLSHGFNPKDDGSVLDYLEKVFAKSKDQTALVCGEERLTYWELDQKSRAIAHVLKEENADPTKPIGIYLHRSVDYVVSMIGIMRYGGYYLALDPEYPDERIQQYLTGSSCEWVISRKGNFELGNQDIKTLKIDSIEITKNIDNQLFKDVKCSDYAYLIFTSGSTNKPKGVPISHANLCSSYKARLDYYSELPESFLMVSSFAFDSSVAGIYWTLATGGKLIISKNKESLDSTSLTRLIQREEVTHTLMLPSLYQAILSQSLPQSLKHVIVAGEECPPSLPEMHFKKNPEGRLYNEYGPTEGTVWCTVHEFQKETYRDKAPIGLASSNTLAYILDEHQKLVPTGLSGELCIAGPAVAGGYLDAKETEEKFLKNPYSKDWDRIYRTGDLVRIQADGLLEYLGRIDNQIKIRGHRIELNEIQNVTNSFKDIEKSVALVIDSDSPVIALAWKAQKKIEAGDLQSFLQEKLPAYMIPSQFLQLEKFPLLPNGKVDQKELGELFRKEPKTEKQVYEKKAGTYLQNQVANIWADVLGLEEVPVNVDFNALGGNSLLSIRIIARCRALGLKVTPEQFLRYSTVESLVNSVGHEQYQRPGNLQELEILKIWEKELSQKLIGVNDSFKNNGGSAYEWKRVEEELKNRFDFKEMINIENTISSISTKVKSSKNTVNQEIKRIIPISTIGKENPLFCVHSEFYYETVYSQLTRQLSSDYPVYGLLSVSPELVKDQVPEGIPEVAELCIRDMKKVQPKGPYRLLSYSIGNVVAFEMARQLLEEGEKVQLIMIDPPLFFDESRVFGKGGYKKLFTHLELWKKPATLFNKLKKKLSNEKKPALIEDTGLLKKFLYAYQPKHVNVDTLLITTPSEFKHTYGWEPLVNVVDTERIQGPHMKLMREPYASKMNEAIERSLRKWDKEG
ncbi:non-ribosomal peptide synthetase [Algoriphagus sediminis]|uniref:Amino acid adenylation domain-containing protein n=1 Tax=Algoriphagus sediminis TaxID=3057113 RepID=A0ABT7YCZ6_9BACT|nr:amino acid adenylation domain-containing protein [Algoriphagus sediminis]MDN3204400.1 amino acid adenylation domain-containing protein [Algoriphagus sediminis]